MISILAYLVGLILILRVTYEISEQLRFKISIFRDNYSKRFPYTTTEDASFVAFRRAVLLEVYLNDPGNWEIVESSLLADIRGNYLRLSEEELAFDSKVKLPRRLFNSDQQLGRLIEVGSEFSELDLLAYVADLKTQMTSTENLLCGLVIEKLRLSKVVGDIWIGVQRLPFWLRRRNRFGWRLILRTNKRSEVAEVLSNWNIGIGIDFAEPIEQFKDVFDCQDTAKPGEVGGKIGPFYNTCLHVVEHHGNPCGCCSYFQIPRRLKVDSALLARSECFGVSTLVRTRVALQSQLRESLEKRTPLKMVPSKNRRLGFLMFPYGKFIPQDCFDSEPIIGVAKRGVEFMGIQFRLIDAII